MTTFLDHKDNEYEAQTVIKATNAVNGERSLTGTIYTNEEVLNKIDKGWKIKFQDEFYRVIFAKPIDTGNKIQVDFDAVHQFFYDFDKSSVHSQLQDGSHTFQTYLNFIFDGSGYSYNLEVTVNALNKQSFGYKSRLDLFNDIVKSSGIEFFVSGKVVRILQKTGTDLSTIVRKNFNMNELGIEKKINDFVTYQKGFGAWNNKDDHSKGRLEVEYTSPLASEYGIIEAEPLVDERYTNADSLLASLKQNVDSSYSISVQIDMEDLTKAGYQYTQPVAGDYIMAINETVGFKEKIRIVSFTSEYDVTGKLISHKVTCNDIGTVKKQSNVVNRLSGQLNSNETKLIEIESTAKEALVSADGKNTNYYGTEMPVDSPKGTLKTGDLLFLTVGDTTKQYYWNGAEWVINPFSNDIDFVKKDINDKISEANAAIKNGDDALNQKYDEIVAKTISHDTLISQAQSTADSAKTDATTALSNIASESQKLTEQINALSKTEGDHYTATNQTLTQLDGTVKGLQTDYTALVNKDNEITQTLTNYKQTIDQNTASITENKQSVDGTISSLQTQVTQNKNDIATKASQLTVNNLSGRMSSAETTITQNANEISTRLSQTNIESLITSKATVITDNKVKETSESFSREITRVDGKIDGMSVGSVNYIVKSNKQFTDKGVKASGITVTVTDGILHVESVAGNGNYLNFDWLGRYSEYLTPAENKFNEGDDFTITFWCKRISGTGNPNVYIKSGIGYYPLSGELNSTEFKPISYTGKWKKANVINLHLGFQYAIGVFEFEKLKLSKGNITTDWSPSPEDMVMLTSFNIVKDTVDSHTQQIGQQGSSLTTTIQRVDSIQSSVSSIDGRLSTVTQTADGLVTTVQNLSVGGNNLLLNADFELLENKTSFTVGGVTYSQGPKYWSTYNGGIPNPGTSFHSYSGSFGGRNNVVIFNESDGSRNWKAINQSIGKTIMSDFPDSTDDFILSFDAYADLSGAKLFGGFYYTNKSTGSVAFHSGQFNFSSITSGSWNRYSVKVPFNKVLCDFSKTFSFIIYGYGFTSNAVLAIDNVKLETGTISSAFSKSKKELDDQISSIQTTVTQTANSWAVKNLTSNGSILSQINLTDGTVKIDGKYVKITGQTLIDNGIITNAMIKDLTADKIIGGTIDANKISVINLNASNITSGQISGGLIKGGVLTALNGAMSIDLNNGTTEMYNDNPAIRRVTADLPNQFIKFSTGTQPNDNNYRIIGSGTKSNLTAAITSIGTNRLRTESNLDGGFTGINIYAGGAGTGDNIVDRVEISSDILKIAHSANSSDRGWVFENINGLNNQYVFRPNTTYQDTYKAMIGTSLNPVDEMYINEMYIKGQRLGYILKDIANRIGNVGSWAAVIS
ncbi:phage tail protein [Streptococcus uberis]|uniref:phage tail protein n=1 Tax=Streptococcus uberis TaxID=1349 RepID=UPI001FF3C71C|nr:phage tail protein [Streptococcus uberis]MCK1226226.1 gp58-like family protein [Streptococcus uberis]